MRWILPQLPLRTALGSWESQPIQDLDRPLANRPVLERKHPPEMLWDSVYWTLYDLGEVRDTHRFESIRKFRLVKGPTSLLTPFTPRVPLWRCEVINSQVHRNLWLALAAAAVLTAAGCSNPATDETSKTAKAAKPAAAAKPVAVAKAAEPATMITLPKGTAISAAARQTLATDKNKVGDTFAASLTHPS